MAGQHVVAQTDGGRVRIRTQVETTKRKGVKHRRKIRVEWREPKLLILYLSDRKGRMLKGTRPWIDGTMNGPDHLMELMAFHLHRLGAARAKAVSFVSDGAPWIWNRLDWVIGRAGLDPKRVERVLDCCHAVHHVSLALQALGLPEAERTATYRTLRHQLRAGRSRRWWPRCGGWRRAQPLDSAVWVEIEYLDKHEAHLRYDWFGYRGHPLGSGAVESRDPAGDQPAAQGQRDLLARGERGGDAGAACGGVDGPMGGGDGEGPGGDGGGPSARLAMGSTGHRGGVELGSRDQATDAATTTLRLDFRTFTGVVDGARRADHHARCRYPGGC